jgi:hypothetical protein
VVDVSDRAHVAVRLRPFKLCFRHVLYALRCYLDPGRHVRRQPCRSRTDCIHVLERVMGIEPT